MQLAGSLLVRFGGKSAPVMAPFEVEVGISQALLAAGIRRVDDGP